MSGVFGHRFGRKNSRTCGRSTPKYCSSSHLLFRQAK
jgi:hypothetical protein